MQVSIKRKIQPCKLLLRLGPGQAQWWFDSSPVQCPDRRASVCSCRRWRRTGRATRTATTKTRSRRSDRCCWNVWQATLYFYSIWKCFITISVYEDKNSYLGLFLKLIFLIHLKSLVVANWWDNHILSLSYWAVVVCGAEVACSLLETEVLGSISNISSLRDQPWPSGFSSHFFLIISFFSFTAY